MTSLTILKDIAIRTLRASVQAGVCPGDMLGPHLFPRKVHFPEGKFSDFPDAMLYAAEEGWVEKLAGDQFRLTPAGFGTANSVT